MLKKKGTGVGGSVAQLWAEPLASLAAARGPGLSELVRVTRFLEGWGQGWGGAPCPTCICVRSSTCFHM